MHFLRVELFWGVGHVYFQPSLGVGQQTFKLKCGVGRVFFKQALFQILQSTHLYTFWPAPYDEKSENRTRAGSSGRWSFGTWLLRTRVAIMLFMLFQILSADAYRPWKKEKSKLENLVFVTFLHNSISTARRQRISQQVSTGIFYAAKII